MNQRGDVTFSGVAKMSKREQGTTFTIKHRLKLSNEQRDLKPNLLLLLSSLKISWIRFSEVFYLSPLYLRKFQLQKIFPSLSKEDQHSTKNQN